MGFEPRSPAFTQGADIPKKFTCDGQDLSLALAWDAPPAGTRSLALVMDDPDAPLGTWVHWVFFDLPVELRALPEGVPKDKEPKLGGRQGSNSWKRIGYGGPCPPPGPAHRYFFKFYALDRKLELPAGAAKADVEMAMRGHILAHGELMGKYKR